MRDYRIVSAELASATTLGDAVDLGAGFSRVYLQIPTMATSTLINLLAAESLAGTYLPVHQGLLANTATSAAPEKFQFITAACAGVHAIPAGLRYVKLQIKTMVSNNATAFNFICSED